MEGWTETSELVQLGQLSAAFLSFLFSHSLRRTARQATFGPKIASCARVTP
jgi:hypothetical protein